MRNTLESVIDYCTTRCGLEVMPEERKSYYAALRKHYKSINGFDINTPADKLVKHNFPFFKHLADYLILYSYLSGRSKIKLGEGKEKKIETIEDLRLLSMKNIGANGQGKREDLMLSRAYGRIQQRQFDHDFPSVPEIIDYIGRQCGINRRFGLKKTESLYSKILCGPSKHYIRQ